MGKGNVDAYRKKIKFGNDAPLDTWTTTSRGAGRVKTRALGAFANIGWMAAPCSSAKLAEPHTITLWLSNVVCAATSSRGLISTNMYTNGRTTIRALMIMREMR